MHWIGRGGDEIKFLVEAPGLLILRVHRERADAGNIGRLDSALHRVPQKRLADALAVRPPIHRQARKEHDQYRMARQPSSETFGRFLAGHLAYGEGVIADNGSPHETDVGLGGFGLLVRPCVLQQIPVKLLPAAVKIFSRVIGAEFFNAAGGTH